MPAFCFTWLAHPTCGPNNTPSASWTCRKYGELLRHNGEAPVAVRRCETVEEVLKEADVSTPTADVIGFGGLGGGGGGGARGG